jgi:hypothetical protein
MGLLLDAERLRIDSDERVGFAQVAAARDDWKPTGLWAEGPNDVKILEARLDRHRFSLCVFGASDR